MKADPVVEWLLDGDPSIRWQTMRDLTGAAERMWVREQRRVPKDGWGARLIALQGADGRWAGSIYTPKWISTTYTMVLLRSFGLPPQQPQARRACRILLDDGCWTDGGINYYPRAEAQRDVIGQQMPDGGWNCRAMPGYGGATHGSFHTTISALEALLAFERLRPTRTAAARKAQSRGREFLLVHRLFRSHPTGEISKPEFLRFAFPPRWHYDVLHGLDWFRDANAPHDERLSDAIAVVEQRHARCVCCAGGKTGRMKFRCGGSPSRCWRRW